jgi:hypothetical protein
MADGALQNYSTHTRFDALFHFFILPVSAITFIVTIVQLVRHPGLCSAWLVVVAIAGVAVVAKIRVYPLKVQDRVIRLEERLRLADLIDSALHPRISELREGQLVALRFASDGELPALAARALNEKLSSFDIKKAIQHWRADDWRV